jgi:phage portal protein BeeE
MQARRGVTPSFCRITLTTDHRQKRYSKSSLRNGLNTASGLLDMQRHCLLSQTFDEKPEQTFVEAFASALLASASTFLKILFSSCDV